MIVYDDRENGKETNAMLLANSQRLSHRTHHFNVKYHWFCECVKDLTLGAGRGALERIGSVQTVVPRFWSEN